MTNKNKILGAASLIALLSMSACGGGGGGGGGNNPPPPPPPTSSPGSFTLSANTASFTMYSGRSAPAGTTLDLRVTNATNVGIVGLAYVEPNQPAEWLTANITGTSPDFDVELSVSQGALAPGSYQAVITAGTATAAGAVLSSRNITVNFEINPMTVVGQASQLNTTVVFGHSTSAFSQDAPVSAPAGTEWTVTSTAAWLGAPDTEFTGDATIPVTVDAAGLAIGTYTGTLRYASQTEDEDYTEQTFTLNVVAPEFAVLPASLLLGGVDGTLDPTGTMQVALGTGTNSYPLSIEVATDDGEPWLDVDSPASEVGGAGLTLTVSGEKTAVPTGAYAGTVTLSADVNGQVFTQVRPVTFNYETHKLVASALGVGFSQFPSRSVLTRELRISSSLDRTDIPWEAEADAAWLSVTAGGMTGGELALTADPTGLASGQLHEAIVTVTSSHPLNVNEQQIRVSLWIGASDPVDTWSAAEGVFLAASPVDPRVYLGMINGDIQVYDVYSGALVDTFPAVVPGSNNLAGLAISDDGQSLFVSEWMGRRILQIDAYTGAQGPVYEGMPENYVRLYYVRPDAHPMLILGTSQALDLETGELMSQGLVFTGQNNGASFVVDESQRILFAQNAGISASTVARYRIGYSSLLPEHWYAEQTHDGSGGSNGQDLCLSADQQRVYTANGAPYEFHVFSADTLEPLGTLPATAYPQSTECAWSGLFVGGAMVSSNEPYNTWFYDESGGTVLEQLLRGAGHAVTRDGVRFSPDATRVITVSGGPSLSINFTNAPVQ